MKKYSDLIDELILLDEPLSVQFESEADFKTFRSGLSNAKSRAGLVDYALTADFNKETLVGIFTLVPKEESAIKVKFKVI